MAGFIGPLKLHYLVASDCYNPRRELSVVSIESLSSVEYNTKFLHFIAGSYGGKNFVYIRMISVVLLQICILLIFCQV